MLISYGSLTKVTSSHLHLRIGILGVILCQHWLVVNRCDARVGSSDRLSVKVQHVAFAARLIAVAILSSASADQNNTKSNYSNP